MKNIIRVIAIAAATALPVAAFAQGAPKKDPPAAPAASPKADDKGAAKADDKGAAKADDKGAAKAEAKPKKGKKGGKKDAAAPADAPK
jgi:hypothetical protein